MARTIDKARDASRRSQKRLAGVTISYNHDPADKNWTLAGLPATVGTTTTDEISEYQTVTTARHRDYLIDQAELVDQDDTTQTFEPKKGDQITETIAGSSAVFIVTEDPSGATWRWHDRQRSILRIHTVESSR